METLYFTRTFTRGLLKGLSQTDKVSFPTVEACADWRNRVNAKHAKGRLDYYISDASFQKYRD